MRLVLGLSGYDDYGSGPVVEFSAEGSATFLALDADAWCELDQPARVTVTCEAVLFEQDPPPRPVALVAGMAGDCRECGRLILPDEPIDGFVPFHGWLCVTCRDVD